MGTLIFSQSELPPPEEGDPLEVSLGNHGTLSSMPSSTSTHTLRTSVLLLSPTITHFIISHLHFRSIFLQASHLLLNVVCCCQGPVCLHCSLGVSWPSCLSFLFLNSICNGSKTFLDSTHCLFCLNLSPSPIDWAAQAESNIPCTPKGKLLFEQSLTNK